ncbi:MAG: hypothetical protein H0T68_05310 [Gemmatimonadales bacterium]|nr:hypothetical protein [Gemmatimonadales bacterium]
MFPGSPAPLRPGTPLTSVVRLAQPGVPLGAWVRGCKRLFVLRAPGRRKVLVGPDLAALLRRCDRVVIRDGEVAVAFAASVLVGWRVLEVVLGTPFLPPPAQLRVLFPRLRSAPGTLAIPIGLGSAEEALAICARERVPVVGTRIAYEIASG